MLPAALRAVAARWLCDCGHGFSPGPRWWHLSACRYRRLAARRTRRPP